MLQSYEVDFEFSKNTESLPVPMLVLFYPVREKKRLIKEQKKHLFLYTSMKPIN